MQKNKFLLLFTSIIALTLLITSCGGNVKKTFKTAPPLTIDQNKEYTATMKTNYGDIVLQLFPKDAPLTVNNFVFLARQGFYDGVKFHRVVKGFMIQGGDPTGTGSSGPGYQFKDELPTTLDYTKGTIAMANAGPNTNGSQFFITYAPQHHLDGKHSVFGQLAEGMDVLQQIEPGDVIVRITIKES